MKMELRRRLDQIFNPEVLTDVQVFPRKLLWRMVALELEQNDTRGIAYQRLLF